MIGKIMVIFSCNQLGAGANIRSITPYKMQEKDASSHITSYQPINLYVSRSHCQTYPQVHHSRKPDSIIVEKLDSTTLIDHQKA